MTAQNQTPPPTVTVNISPETHREAKAIAAITGEPLGWFCDRVIADALAKERRAAQRRLEQLKRRHRSNRSLRVHPRTIGNFTEHGK